MAEDLQKEILTFYEKLLNAVGAEVNHQGLVSIKTIDGLSPLTVENKRMVLPTKDILRTSDWDNVQPFHPICEHVMLGESVVLKRLRFLVAYRLNEVGAVLAAELMRIAADKNQHKFLPPSASDFLIQMAHADENTLDVFYKVLAKAGATSETPMIHIFLKRSAKLGEFSFTRAAIINFPLLEAIDDDVVEETQFKVAKGNGAASTGHSLLGIKMRKTDKECIVALFRYMFPDHNKPTTYSVGSSAMTAPFFQALIRTFVKMTKHFNGIMKDFKGVLNKEFDDILKIDLGWEPYIDNLDQFRDHIPVLAGNDGERKADQKELVPEHTQRGGAPEDARNLMRRDPNTFREPQRTSGQQPQHTQQQTDQQRTEYGNRTKMPAANATSVEDESWEESVNRIERSQYQGPRWTPTGRQSGYPPSNYQPPVQYAPNGRPIQQPPMNRYYNGYPPATPYGYDRRGYGGYEQQYSQYQHPVPGQDPFGGSMPKFRGASSGRGRY